MHRGLRVLLTLIGVVAMVAGTVSVLFGAAVIPAHGEVSASVDSEMRFYAVWYVAVGVVALRAAPRIEESGAIVGGLAAAFGAAGLARALSWAMVGRPHFTTLVLMVVELALALVLATLRSTAGSPVRRATPPEPPGG
ncbi:MAG: DUF4345 domain-containing protein [Actinobacteria bacterium]|jgi:hypothetical protein|nr:DUF4345 domain-containing protein [Actinomycetota bacterium]